jgi:hypothetical protein
MKFDREKFDQQQIERRLWFARHCWVRRYESVPGKDYTWGESFEKKEGMSLDEYKILRSKIKDNV